MMARVRLSVDVSTPHRAILHRGITDDQISNIELVLEEFLSARGVEGVFHGLLRISSRKIRGKTKVIYDYFEEASNIAVFLVRVDSRVYNCRLSLPSLEYRDVFLFRIKSGESAAILDDQTIQTLINAPTTIQDGQRVINDHLANIANFQQIIQSYKDRIYRERQEILQIRHTIARLERMIKLAKELGYPV